MPKEMTPRQRQILQFILQHIEARGYPPTVREIGEAVNLSSSSTVHAHLRSLEEAGLIKRDAVLTRAIKLLPGTAKKTKTKRVVCIPVVERASCADDIFEHCEESYSVPFDLLSGSDGFMLRVNGDGMIEDGIKDGDLVIVRRMKSAEDGDVVAVVLEGEAVVKKFFREGSKVCLHPANPTMNPVILDDAAILGKVVGLVRRM